MPRAIAAGVCKQRPFLRSAHSGQVSIAIASLLCPPRFCPTSTRLGGDWFFITGWRPLCLCMSWCWIVFLINNFVGAKGVISLDSFSCSHCDCQDYPFEAQVCKEKESSGTFQVAPSSHWVAHPDRRSAELACNSAFIASQQRSSFATSYSCRDGVPTAGQCRMDVWKLQESPGKECVVLRSLRLGMGRLLRQPAEEEQDQRQINVQTCLLDGTRSSTLGRCTWREKSKTEPEKAAAQEQSGTWQRKRKGEEQRWCSASQQALAPPPPPPLGGPEGNPPLWMSMPLPPGANATRCQCHLGHNGSPLPCRAEAEG